jgi:4-amino-4-deoxy-L-arabinose transferase-like glycosyltransferase
VASMLEANAGIRSRSPLRVISWGAGLFLLGALLSLLGMLAKPAQFTFPFAEMLCVLLGVSLASGGILAVLGQFGPVASPEAVAVPASALLPGLSSLVGSGVALRVLVHRAIMGVVPAPRWSLGVLVPALCLGMLWGAWHVVDQLLPAESRATGPLWRRAWPVWLTVLLYVPMLGSFGMIDPWEAEYSEVAREMLSRHDWISLWFGDQGWFFSKPVLDFWLEGISYTWFGLDPTPGALLQGVAMGRVPAPEWAARLPIFACALAGQLVLARGVARYFGQRAANIGSLILVTCPYWFLLTRQTMVDMPYAAPLAAALGFLLLAAAAGETERARDYRIQLGRRSVSLSGYHVLFFGIAALALVQIFYLVSRHVSFELSPHAGIHLHVDRVWMGSPGNCTLPGNAACNLDRAATDAHPQSGIMALLWAACLAALAWCERGERSLRGLYHLAAWTCVALSLMAKAAPGLVLPVCTYGAWLLWKGRLAELRRAKLMGLVLILACVAAPWFVQAYLRHGSPFFDELFMHDMYNRAFGHVHDTNTGDDTSFTYYVWQLGYGLFPWSGVVAVGTLYCIGKSSLSQTGSKFRDATALFVLWQLACFGLFSIAGTKFHHYILPLVPAAAMLGGVWLAELWQAERSTRLTCLGLLALVPTLLAARDLAYPGNMPGAARLMHLFTYLYTRPWPEQLDFRVPLAVFGGVAALFCAGVDIPRLCRGAVAGLCGAGVAFTLWAVDVYLVEVAPHWSQRDTISAYYRARRGPEELLVAYRQNWMGENFYTENHLATFKAAGKSFEDWIAEQRRSGAHVLFFTTEHTTVERLKRELGGFERFELLTTPAENNKFVLARVTL